LHNNNNNNGNGLHPTQPQNNHGNSPLAQFFNSNNFNNAQQPRPAPPADIKTPKEKKPMNGQQQQQHQKISAPPGFNSKAQQQQQPPQKNLLAKETKLITPMMFAAPSEKKTPVTAEPLTKNQLLQAMNYLIENDDEFMLKIHQAYIKSFKSLSS
jgi:mRNA-decapping enzyme C-terminus